MSNTKPGTAQAKQFIKNDRTIVTGWRFKQRGDNTGWHRHIHDYVIVPLTDGVVKIDLGGGEFTSATMQKGVPYFRERGVEHDVISDNDFEFAFMEIEII